MHPTTSPTTVRARKVVMPALPALQVEVRAVAVEAETLRVDAGELPPLDLGDDEADRWGLACRSTRGQHAVAVVRLDVAQRGHHVAPRGLGSGRLERLHEH